MTPRQQTQSIPLTIHLQLLRPPLPLPPTLMPHRLPQSMPATSTSSCAPHHQQHFSEHLTAVKSSPPSLGQHQHYSRTIYLATLPLTRDTCTDTDPTPAPHKIRRITLSPCMPKLSTCSPDKNHVPCRMYFVLPHLPMPLLAQCTPTSPVPSLFAHSKVCNTFCCVYL